MDPGSSGGMLTKRALNHAAAIYGHK